MILKTKLERKTGFSKEKGKTVDNNSKD